MGENNGKGKQVRELFAEEVHKKANSGWQYDRNLLETIIDSLIAVGPDGIITDVNDATEKAIGLPREEIINTDFSEYFTEPDKACALYKRAYDIGKVIDYELNLKHISGSSIPVLLNASVYKDNEGQIIGVLATAKDISAIIEYEDGLINKKNDLELIVRQKTAEIDTQKIERTFQSEEKAKRAADLIIANKELAFQNDEKEERAAELVLANRELVFQTSEKADRAAELIIANRELMLQNEELDKRAAMLIASNKELEALTYSISHDLKAPLRHITGYISLLVKKHKDLLPEEGRRYLDNISFSAMNMGELIDGLLQFSRTGTIKMNQKLLDMNEIVDALIQPNREQDQQHRIEFHINPLPPAFGDLEMIKSVWNNLIENAVKFSRNKDLAKIYIGAVENDTENIYYIKDNGVGFDMNYAAELFTVFQRLHRREDFEGTGIGLATVQKIIARHGGRIWAEGKVGEGAAFYFTFIKRNER